MKEEELIKLKEEVLYLKEKRDKVLKIQEEIKRLENTEEVKRYLDLLDIFAKNTTGRNTGIDKYTDDNIINIALNSTKITPDDEIYVYLGTYRYNDEVDIIHGTYDIPVSRYDCKASYDLYQNIESKDDESIQIPSKESYKFEITHNIIVPLNVANRKEFFYDLQREYFKTMIFESPQKAKEKVKKLIRKLKK